MQYLQAFSDFQENFSGDDLIQWMDNHTEVPVFAVSVYLAIIFKVPELLKDSKPITLRPFFALWNLLLATFSMAGSYYTIPRLIQAISEKGFRYTVCEDPRADYYFYGPSGLWVALFIWSKIPELVDTVFLVVQKKPVIFLHWFHHVTVMLYCWHAYRQRMSNGLWFAAMNFFVHSIMYSYYFFMAVNLKALVKPIAPIITSLQLAQMVVGMFVTASAWYYHVPGDLSVCHAETSNIKMGLAMYSSYFVLFAMLFKKLYLSKGGKRGGNSKDAAKDARAKQEEDICSAAGVTVSHVDDVAKAAKKKN